MRIISGSKIRRYVAIVGIFLITAALIIGMVGCGSGQCSLTIHYTEGGWAWAPSGETSNLDYGTVVQLEAGASTCYEFVNWTGDVGTIADAEDAYTTITMNGSYVITANFAPKVSENMEIWDWYDLYAVRDNLCWNYTLMNDLNSTTPGYEELAGPMANGGTGWRPIGYRDIELYHPFKGIFNGQGYEIHDLFIHSNYFFELGLFGLSYGVIEYIGVVNATVVGVGAFLVGALVGINEGTVSNSYSTGNVSTDEDYGMVGGLVGINEGTVIDSYSAASVISSGCIGGLVGGNSQGTVDNCYSTGNVTGNDYVGGLVGWNRGTVSNSYSTGSVTGSENVGGLVGYNREGTVSNSYSTGSVTGDVCVGGLVGKNEDTVTGSFWDTETSGQASSDGGTGKNTTEMKDINTFSAAGWNIVAVALNQTNPAYIWNIVNNVTYPFLSWEL